MGGCASKSDRREDIKVDKVALLQKTPFLICMDEDAMAQFADAFRVTRVPTGVSIYKKNDETEEFYILVDGEVKVSAPDSDNNERQLCVRKGGEFFGEGPLFAGPPEDPPVRRTSSVTTSMQCTFMLLDRDHLERFFKKQSTEARVELRKQMAAVMGQRVDNLLKKTPFLSQENISENKLEVLSSLLKYVTIDANRIVFSEGDIGSELYFVLTGRLRATAKGQDGQPVVLAEFTAGQYFGEISMVVNTPRTATITAAERCLLLSLHRKDLQHFLRLFPEMKHTFDRVAKQRTAEHFKRFKVPFFAAIPEDRYVDLADLSTLEQYLPNTVIFAEGDSGDAFYIVIYGELQVTVTKPDRGAVVLGTMGPGRYFGEIALVKECKRTATVTTLTRCAILTITKENFDKFFVSAPEALADFHIKVAPYNIELKKFIHHPLGLEYFTRHMKKEFSEESISFWKAVNDFKEIAEDNHDALLTKAKEIVQQFVVADAPQTVNLSAAVREKTLTEVASGHVNHNSFHTAHEAILKLMGMDSFQRFKQSQLFQEFVERAQTYGDTIDTSDVKIEMKK
eukprot:Opistho-2@2825